MCLLSASIYSSATNDYVRSSESSADAEKYIQENLEFIAEVVGHMGYLGADYNPKSTIKQLSWELAGSSYAITSQSGETRLMSAKDSIFQLVDTHYGYLFLLRLDGELVSQVIIGNSNGEYQLLEAGAVSPALLEALKIIDTQSEVKAEDVVVLGFPDTTCVVVDVSGETEMCLVISGSEYSGKLYRVSDYIGWFQNEYSTKENSGGAAGGLSALDSFIPTSSDLISGQSVQQNNVLIYAISIISILAVAAAIIVFTKKRAVKK
jgi:hypothetical protein